VTAVVISEYERSCNEVLAVVAGGHTLAGGHMGIHRVQIERIVKGLEATNPRVAGYRDANLVTAIHLMHLAKRKADAMNPQPMLSYLRTGKSASKPGDFASWPTR
jgi:hypothetical protein